jgi:hypothetical protein
MKQISQIVKFTWIYTNHSTRVTHINIPDKQAMRDELLREHKDTKRRHPSTHICTTLVTRVRYMPTPVTVIF